MELYLATGDRCYFDRKPVAHFNRRYELVYTNDGLSAYYGFKGDFGIPSLLKDVEGLQREGRDGILAARQRKKTAQELKQRPQELKRRIERIIAMQDGQGRWIEDGRIQTRTFIRDVESLAEYLQILRAL